MVYITLPAAALGAADIENACGGITGRSPAFGYHLSARQTRNTSGDPVPTLYSLIPRRRSATSSRERPDCEGCEGCDPKP